MTIVVCLPTKSNRKEKSVGAMDSEVKSKLASHGQDHLLRYTESLGESQLTELYTELAELDLNKVSKCWSDAQKKLSETCELNEEQLEPLDRSIVGSTSRDKDTVPRWESVGLEKIGGNQVAVLLLAGGQGTRLGVDYPKGMYNVGLPSGKTLYQLQAERILKLQQLASKKCGKSCTIPWYIMTSEHTREPTIRFFESHKYFGLNPTNVIVFEQNTFPCLEFDGKIILAERHRLARSPDGNGGLYAALANPRTKVIADLRSRGIQFIHVYCVDNILVKMADPVFVGFCVEKGAECGAKVVLKTQPTERVGVVCRYDNRYQVVEYSEINISTAEQRNADGTLTFNAGNICNHFFTFDFLERVCKEHDQDLIYHVAKKKISYVGADGCIVKPTKPNGIKLEKFVFDVFQFAKSFAVLEVLREDEFSPLKNAPGADKDTPATAKAALMDLHYRQLLSAGGTLIDSDGRKLPLIPQRDCNSPGGGEGDSNGSQIVCEISPLLSYFGEGLKEVCDGRKFTTPVHLEADLSSFTNGNGNGNGHRGPELKRPRND